MAHFISDVTHQKLDQRREEVTRTNIKGLQCVDDFAAYVRCVANVVHHSLAESNEALIWTGNQDGSISIRRGVLGEVVKHIERKKNVFVYCLVQCGGHMWAGLSDGYLRIFDIETFELVFETKMHAGGITCMLFVQGYIFSGGYDWQILQWDPTYLQLAPRGQFSGHQNAVRCMATDGNVLYSGGDDHAIRCWDLDLGQEKAAPWPIVGHGDGVRALTVIEVYLFSASQDGTVKVWNTQTVQLVRVLDHRDAAYYTLLHDESCGRIWAGNTDGTITVWNATSLDPIATMTDHTGSSVVRLHKLNRINATKIWSYAKNGSVKVWFSESDPTASDMDLLSLAETELNHKVETMRNNIIHNYGELEQRRNELDTLEFLESQRKSKMVQTMTRGVYGGIACYYFEKLMEWRLRCMKIRKMKHSAYTMYMSNESHLQKRYFAKLRNYIQVSKDAARKRELGESLLRSTENGLKLTYLTTLLEYSRNLHIRSQKKLIANAMGRSANRELLRVTYNRWIGYCTELHHFRKANVLLGKLQQEKDLNMIAHFWAILNTNAVARSEVNVYRNIIHSIQRSNSVTLTRIYFTKLSAFVNRRLDKRGILASEAFMATSDSTLRRCYYQKLKRFRDIQNSIPLETQLAELQRKSRELDLIIRQRSFMNADSIQRDLEFRNQFYESSIQRALDAEKLVEQEQRKLKQLGAEFRNCARPSYMFRSMNDDPFVSSVSLLKILLNCDYHFDYITQSQSKGVQDPHKLFDSGVRKIAAAYREVVAPSDLIDPATGEWAVTTETIDKLVHTKKLSTLGKEGLSDIVVASDILNHQITRHASSVNMTDMDTQKYRDEFLRNINAFVDLAMALHEYQKELISRRAVRSSGSGIFSPSQSSTSFRKVGSRASLERGSSISSIMHSSSLSPTRSMRAGSSFISSPNQNATSSPLRSSAAGMAGGFSQNRSSSSTSVSTTNATRDLTSNMSSPLSPLLFSFEGNSTPNSAYRSDSVPFDTVRSPQAILSSNRSRSLIGGDSTLESNERLFSMNPAQTTVESVSTTDSTTHRIQHTAQYTVRTSNVSYVQTTSVVAATSTERNPTSSDNVAITSSGSFYAPNLDALNLKRDIVDVPYVPQESALEKFLKSQGR